MHDAKASEAEHHEGLSHVMSKRMLVGVWLALMVLTGLTVGTDYFIDAGRFNIVLALGIATIKGFLVAAFFMHLRHDRPFNVLVFLASLLFAGIFLSMSILDTKEYQPDIIQDPPAKTP
jgi:cytochrome c oxidase subunit 4